MTGLLNIVPRWSSSDPWIGKVSGKQFLSSVCSRTAVLDLGLWKSPAFHTILEGSEAPGDNPSHMRDP